MGAFSVGIIPVIRSVNRLLRKNRAVAHNSAKRFRGVPGGDILIFPGNDFGKHQFPSVKLHAVRAAPEIKHQGYSAAVKLP